MPRKYQSSPFALEPPFWSSPVRRAKRPYDAISDVPGAVRPSFVWIDSAPPDVFRPNRGLEPGMSVIDAIAPRGIRSQLTTSPNGWFNRTPSIYSDRP